MAPSRVALLASIASALILLCSAMVPLPQKLTYGSQTLPLSSQMAFFSSSPSQILQGALQRVKSQIFMFPSSSTPTNYHLNVTVLSSDENLQFGVDESYTLEVTQNRVNIQASTIWGAMHGLQTFTQLVVWDGSNYSVPSLPIRIDDAPRFPWRGLLIDTARHFMDVATLKRQVVAMEASKLNVLHWHAVDAESFPMMSNSEPALSKGAYAPSARFSIQDMKDVITFAKNRGIRTVVEFDVPGHAASWSAGFPDITVNCPQYMHNINNIPLNPTLDKTWTVLTNLFTEMASLFPDQYFHTGGDEVVTGCFTNNQQVLNWMNQNGMTTGTQLYAYFEKRLAAIMSNLKKKHLVWEDVFNAGIALDKKETLVEVWSNHQTLASLTAQGIKAITSAGWYLGVQIPESGVTHGLFFDTWQDFYNNEPILPEMTQSQAQLVQGGEACMWGEQVNPLTIDAMVWPRAAATAERLWSAKTVTDIPSMKTRLNQHQCLLTRRGISASPIMPGYCAM